MTMSTRHRAARTMNRRDEVLRDVSIDDPDSPPIGHCELRWLIEDFERLVAAGLLHGARHEAAQFFSGWLAFGDRHDRPSSDSLRLIVLPGLAKDDA